jgi:hypothetical protein
MTKLDFEVLFDMAAKRHGHKCPSLYYGVSGATVALEMAGQKNIAIKQAIIQGTSKCIRDGAGSVLETEAQLTPTVSQQGCGLTLGDGKQYLQLKVKPEIREKINRLNKQLPLEEFQREGLKYLTALSKQDIFEVLELQPDDFNRLLHHGE